MKRSEALKVIDDVYGEFCADWMRADLNDLEGFVALNERILSALENAGMVPPQRVKATYDHTLGGYTVPNFEFKHEWEPEQ